MKPTYLTLLVGGLALAGCSGNQQQTTLSGAGGSSGSLSGAGAAGSTGAFANGAGTGTQSTGSGGPCTGLACQIHQCSGGGSTSITGTIYDPAGKNPLYGVVAYVPNSKPAAFTKGASCASCSDLYTGDPIAAAVSDAKGQFTIKNAPDGANIPLVIQVGKWRRQFTIPNVAMCGSTPAPMKLSLPKNGTEGDIPEMAVSTGGADTMECLLRRIGLDASEYVGGPGGSGHFHVFHGSGGDNTSPPGPEAPTGLWSSKADLMKYDIVILSCEGHETDSMNQQAMFDYAAAGGRVFASHFHYAWFNSGPFQSANLAEWSAGANAVGNIDTAIVTTTWAGQPFVRGQAMFDWLKNVNAMNAMNLLHIDQAKHNADLKMSNTPSQPWVVQPPANQATLSTQDFTFDTPLGTSPDKQCGRVAYSDMHVGAASGDNKGTPTPQECANVDLSAQEKALEFIFFDLSSCVTPNNMPQMPPGPMPM